MASRQEESVQGTAAEIALPAPRETGTCSLEEALWLRRSVREFSGVALGLEAIGQLLWAAQGLTDGPDRRTAPSAGATYPLILYVATPEGVFRYVPEGHALQQVAGVDLRPRLRRATYEQESLRHAALVVVLVANYGRTTHRYGADRGVRYVHLEAGHAAQNLLQIGRAHV
jgi:SagB-type dehydrogenase family enzyme